MSAADQPVRIQSGDLLLLLHVLHRKCPIAVANKMNFLNLYCDADFVAVTMAGQVIEYEVKISRSDFCRDRHKLRHKIYSGEHPGVLPNRFWYVTAPGIITAEDIPPWAGWLEYENFALIERVPAPKMRKEQHEPKIFLRLARAMRRRKP